MCVLPQLDLTMEVEKVVASVCHSLLEHLRTKVRRTPGCMTTGALGMGFFPVVYLFPLQYTALIVASADCDSTPAFTWCRRSPGEKNVLQFCYRTSPNQHRMTPKTQEFSIDFPKAGSLPANFFPFMVFLCRNHDDYYEKEKHASSLSR